MAAPSVVALGTFVSGAAAISPGIPAGMAAGDSMYLAVETANQAVTTPSGWTFEDNLIGQGTGGAAGAVALYVYSRPWQSGDAAPTIADSGDHQTARIIGIRNSSVAADGVRLNVGFVSQQTTATTAMVCPGVTTTVADCLIVHFTALDLDANSTTAVGTLTNANLTSITERQDQTVNTGAGGGLYIATGIKATAGATGDSTATATSSKFEHYTIALQNFVAVAPAMGLQPQDFKSVPALQASFDATATGDPAVTAQWQVSTNGGANWNNVSTGTGGTTTNYSTANLVIGDNGNKYRCIFTNSAGSVTSNAATLYVFANDNLLWDSEDMTGGSWTKYGSPTVTRSNYSSASGSNYIGQDFTVSPGDTLTFSIVEGIGLTGGTFKIRVYSVTGDAQITSTSFTVGGGA